MLKIFALLFSLVVMTACGQKVPGADNSDGFGITNAGGNPWSSKCGSAEMVIPGVGRSIKSVQFQGSNLTVSESFSSNVDCSSPVATLTVIETLKVQDMTKAKEGGPGVYFIDENITGFMLTPETPNMAAQFTAGGACGITAGWVSKQPMKVTLKTCFGNYLSPRARYNRVQFNTNAKPQTLKFGLFTTYQSGRIAEERPTTYDESSLMTR